MIALLVVLAAANATAADPLFPSPIHLTRRVVDPISGSETVIDEYLYGNRVVSVTASKTAIADYDKGELLEIDRQAGTWSVTKFEEIAKARPAPIRHRLQSVRADDWNVQTRGAATKAGRSATAIEAIRDSGGSEFSRLNVVVDGEIRLSREAFDVLTGAAWPNDRNEEHDVLRRAARAETSSPAGQRLERFALLLEKRVVIEIDGQTIETRDEVLRVAHDLPSARQLEIPRGATKVESRLVLRHKLLDELDRLPDANAP